MSRVVVTRRDVSDVDICLHCLRLFYFGFLSPMHISRLLIPTFIGVFTIHFVSFSVSIRLRKPDIILVHILYRFPEITELNAL